MRNFIHYKDYIILLMKILEANEIKTRRKSIDI